MERTLRLLITCAVICPSLIAQAPSLSVASAYDGGAGPFIRTEMLTISISSAGGGGRPVTLFMGNPLATPMTVPGFSGALGIDPFTIGPFGPYDGLGFFGGSFPLVLDSNGAVSFSIRVPPDLGAPVPLPVGFALQAVVGQPTSPGGEAMAFSNSVDIIVDEPPTSPSITTLDVQVVQEGSAPTIIISGAGFLERATMTVPRVSFLSTTTPGNESDALSVVLIDNDPGPAVLPALMVVAPPSLGPIPTPPTTSAGLALIRVDFGSTGLYNAGNPAATTTTSPAPGDFSAPTYLVYQTGITPVFTSMTPQAGLTAGNCAVAITGAGFLLGAEVRFSQGGSPTTFTPSAITNTQVDFSTPPVGLSGGLFEVVVRNIDHFPSSPKETVLAPPATEFALFRPGLLANVTVTGINPPNVVEGTGGGTIFISGTCPAMGSYTALDSRSGLATVNLGSNLDGTDASAALPIVSVQTPAPGQFVIEALIPDLPPGLNPPGLTSGGIGNAGTKYAQLILPPCLEPSGSPHLTFSAVPATEPGNGFTYFAMAAPQIISIAPNNVGRENGGQSISVVGAGFFTNDTVLPSSNATLLGASGLGGTILESAFADITIIDDQNLVLTTPNLTALGLPLPMQVEAILRNPDGQQATTAGTADDFWIVRSLVGATGSTFGPGPGTLTLNTGVLLIPNIYEFTEDLTIDVATIIEAFGVGPVIIRAGGDIVIDGLIDLSGDSFASAPGPIPATGAPPAGGGPGGRGGDVDLLQGVASGLPGLGPINSLALVPFNNFGLGGFHGPVQPGGGGGGGMAFPGAMGLGFSGTPTGGLGGAALGFANLPFAIAGAGDGTEFFDPPGGGGGAAGGLGTALPYFPGPAASSIGLSGSGGNGGGGILIAADGTITMNGVIDLDGEDGTAGAFDVITGTLPGAGGGGGAGGGLVLQATQGIAVNASAILTARGGLAGPGALIGINDGGPGSLGMIRFTLPAMGIATPQVDGAAVVNPIADTTGW